MPTGSEKPKVPEPGAIGDSGEFAPAAETPIRINVPDYGASSGGNGAGANYKGGALSDSLSALLGDWAGPRMLILFVCSIVVIIQSSIALDRTGGDGGTESYGIAVGSVSLGLGLGIVALAKFKPSLFANWTLPTVPGELSIMQLWSLFSFLWWLPAAAILTFFEPFLYTSNAYFAIWIALVASTQMFSSAFTRVSDLLKLVCMHPMRVYTCASSHVYGMPSRASPTSSSW